MIMNDYILIYNLFVKTMWDLEKNNKTIALSRIETKFLNGAKYLLNKWEINVKQTAHKNSM